MVRFQVMGLLTLLTRLLLALRWLLLMLPVYLLRCQLSSWPLSLFLLFPLSLPQCPYALSFSSSILSRMLEDS